MTPLEELRQAYPEVEWGIVHPPDRDEQALVGTLHGQRVRRPLPNLAVLPGVPDYWALLKDAVHGILTELGLLGPAEFVVLAPARLRRPAHGGYPYAVCLRVQRAMAEAGVPCPTR